MKLLRNIIVIIPVIALLVSCGSATEVGNPIPELPLRTITGTIDLGTVEADTLLQKEITGSTLPKIDPTELTVVATATPYDFIEAQVDADGAFEIRIEVTKTYEWDVRWGGVSIGHFSFEQETGPRRNRLRIMQEGDVIDMGLIQYRNGEFFPEFEPIDQE